MTGIVKGLFQWLYGLFLDLLAYCANALLGVMSTDLQFFETSVPIVTTLYQVFVAIGWGLLIGNCAFQCMKAMFAGLGFETESPAVLLMRTFLFGTLLVFSRDICEIGLSLGKNVINLLGVPTSVTLSLPDEGVFASNSSWLLVIIIGFILGFQLIKLFFEIAERYVIVAILTLVCPVGLAMGGSKSTKDICTGYMRTYASMIVMMVLNVLFLKLVLSALGAMPTGAMVLPWCLLVVGITKTARKADDLVMRIGLSPAITGDPLGSGRGLVTMMMATRMLMGAAGRRYGGNNGGRTPPPQQPNGPHNPPNGHSTNTNNHSVGNRQSNRQQQNTTQTARGGNQQNQSNSSSNSSVRYSSSGNSNSRFGSSVSVGQGGNGSLKTNATSNRGNPNRFGKGAPPSNKGNSQSPSSKGKSGNQTSRPSKNNYHLQKGQGRSKVNQTPLPPQAFSKNPPGQVHKTAHIPSNNLVVSNLGNVKRQKPDLFQPKGGDDHGE